MISTNSLFHFTEKEHLLNILENNFLPRYSIENFSNSKNQEILIGFPMVCFCDIPLSQILDHINTYGKYGIGLFKKWGIKNHAPKFFYTYFDNIQRNTELAKWAVRYNAPKECYKNFNNLLKNIELAKYGIEHNVQDIFYKQFSKLQKNDELVDMVIKRNGKD